MQHRYEIRLKSSYSLTVRNYTIITTDSLIDAKVDTAIVIHNFFPYEPVKIPPLQHLKVTASPNNPLTPQTRIHSETAILTAEFKCRRLYAPTEHVHIPINGAAPNILEMALSS